MRSISYINDLIITPYYQENLTKVELEKRYLIIKFIEDSFEILKLNGDMSTSRRGKAKNY